MHGVRREDFYKTPEEEKAFAEKLKKGFKLLDDFVDNVRRSELELKSEGCLMGDEKEMERMFALSGEITDFMPEFYPSWNYRKNYLLQDSHSADKLHLLLLDELVFTESLLKKAPKCYAVWHHRLWILTILFNKKFEDLSDVLNKEIELCMLFFRFDGRNFHGWSHANFVRHYLKKLESIPKLGVASETDRLCFARFGKLIEKNFSNYSAWFHRGALSETCGSLDSDLDNIVPAIYTDPNDQCIWHYFDWLIYHRNALRFYLVKCCLLKDKGIFVLYFNGPVMLSTANSCIVAIGEGESPKQLEGKWESVKRALCFQRLGDAPIPQNVWRFRLATTLKTQDITHISLTVTIETDDDIVEAYYDHVITAPKCKVGEKEESNQTDYKATLLELGYMIHLDMDEDLVVDHNAFTIRRTNVANDGVWEDMSGILSRPVNLPGTSRMVPIGKDITAGILEDQLKMVTTLIGVGTCSKYLHLAANKINRYLGIARNAEKCYDSVKRLDPLRAAMYDDLLLNETVEDYLDKVQSSKSDAVSMAGIGIKNLSYRTMCPHFMLEELDLGSNSLNDGLKRLSLANNGFTSLRKLLSALQNLSDLISLDVSGNPLSTLESETIKSIPISLRQIDVTETPLISSLVREPENDATNGNITAVHTSLCDSSTGFGKVMGENSTWTFVKTGKGDSQRVYLQRMDT
ncbi:protein farnesyltransferase alpha subunit like protein [Babesia gibsoni]|uniref:Protein farnesyltransferase alpha subunit like protein n=1 Tax=Babesia gibsoni TaxID=33632 RepID=A0AAD8UUD9_BABGI|nr:protein farnesyltransferase alpha subunit like protein [Babesia gibsoni]